VIFGELRTAAWFKKCHFQVALIGFRGGEAKTGK